MKLRSILAAVAFAAVCLAASDLRGQTGPEPPTPDQDPTGHTGALKANVDTGGGYNAHNGNGTRTVTDLYVPSALGDYGLDFTRYWNSLPPGDEPRMAAAMPFNDFGASGWTHSWNWIATYEEILPKIIRGNDGNNETDGVYQTCISITFPDGRVIKYTIRRYWPGGFGYVGDPRHGPPYSAQEANWPAPGQVRDYLEQMAPDGSEFWLHRSDGGSVHFVGSSWVEYQGHKWWSYEAREIYDPHGYKTELEYTDGFLTKVKQENGGRWLTINWAFANGGPMAPVISSVQTGGFADTQTVYYDYAVTGNALTLLKARYPEGTEAGYIYQNSLLMEADDPHFAGAMTRIRYKYRMERCLFYPVSDPPDAHFYYIYAQGEALTEEQSPYDDQYGNPIVVSRFGIACWDGTRTEWNGFGAWRKFYYGHSATWPGSGSHGHELAKVTDFSLTGTNVPSVRQNHLNGNPFQLWDARGIMTQLGYGDGSGLPREVRHAGSDNSFRIYDRIDPGNSAARDPSRIHNPYNRWLFSQTDERNQKTTYTRDARRRITQIDYPGGSSEEFSSYNDFNKYEWHRLASGAQEYFHYDARGRLEWEYNSVDGWEARKEYTYDGFDRVLTMLDGRARAAGKAFTVRMTYNGRHQVTKVEYPDTSQTPCPEATVPPTPPPPPSPTPTPPMPVAVPVFNPDSGIYPGSVTVTVSTATAEANIRYTLDGSTPTESHGTLIAGSSGTVAVTTTAQGTALKAVAFKNSWITSGIKSATYSQPQVAVPEFNPDSGVYPSPVTITITTGTAEANIRYTLDGSIPTESHGTLIAASSGTVAVTSTAQGTPLKAIAFKGGWIASGVSSATYSIPQVAAPAISPASGTYAGWFLVTITTATPEANIRFTIDGTTPTETNGTLISLNSGEIAGTFSAPKQVKAVAFKSGWATSAVASVTYSNGSQVAKPVFTPASGTYQSGQPVLVTITTATPDAWIRWTWDDETPTESHGYIIPASSGTVAVHSPNATTQLNAKAFKTNCYPSAVKFATYYRSTVATPVFNPPTTTAITQPLPVTITTATEQANIRYTLNGTTPTASYGTLIAASSGTVSVPTTGAGTLLKAIAFKSGWTTSTLRSTQYSTQVNMPTFSPTLGKTPISVTIATTTAGASIRYTLDGSIPTDSHGTLIPASSGSVSVPSSYVSLKAVAFMSGYVTSPVRSSSYYYR